ncbi:hypothetical protein Dpo_2c04260 [Desulfotignum phosphitoxidans DSM 13687]|uniref:Uncharacterized protein n=1 Tax=Desulfotignum phosphitoxidans DSM 13687 TaxID=1286635 RepID=S0G1E8_9BACT|nr:hypothetical protein Dpo_2c04260 [Desulfotignum phosphitoxidans DSM 13687]
MVRKKIIKWCPVDRSVLNFDPGYTCKEKRSGKDRRKDGDRSEWTALNRKASLGNGEVIPGYFIG